MITLNWLVHGLALLSSSITSVLAQEIAYAECDAPSFANVVYDGDGKGGGFCASKWKQGILISSIRAKADSDGVRGLKIGFTDNTFVEYGAQWSTHDREGTVE